MLNILAAAGISPDKAQHNQITTAIRELADSSAGGFFEQLAEYRGVEFVNSSSITVSSIYSLLSVKTDRNLTANVYSYHIPSSYLLAVEMPVGGGSYVYNQELPKSRHNGGTIISNTVPWDGRAETHADFLYGVREPSPNGNGCWVFTGSSSSIWRFGAFRFTNDTQQKGIDSTEQVQMALYSAKLGSLTETHSKSNIVTVFANSGDFLISGHIYFPEGCYIVSDEKISSRMVIDFVKTTSKISGYGRRYDELNNKPFGTTFTKNWGLKNISIVPHYAEVSPTSGIVFDLCYDIEVQLSNVRVVLHKGAMNPPGGSMRVEAFRYQKCINPDFFNVTTDGGLYHHRAETNLDFALRGARMRGLFCYNPMEYGVLLRNSSTNNVIECEVEIAGDAGDGSHRGVHIDAGCSVNTIAVTAYGSKLTYGVIADGKSNMVTGTVTGAIIGVEVRGESNTVTMNLNNTSITDVGIGSNITTTGYRKGAGESMGVKRGITLNTASVWIDVAEIIFTPGVTGELRASMLYADIATEITGLNRDCYSSKWFVEHAGQNGTIAATEVTPFSKRNYLLMRVIPTTVHKARLQLQIVTPPGFSGPLAIKSADICFRMYHDVNSRISII